MLTAYVGIDGLLYQMALDGCLPAFLLSKNSWRGTTHWIILSYLVLATSQVLLMEGDVDALAGVYSFAFLGVMGIFSLGACVIVFGLGSSRVCDPSFLGWLCCGDETLANLFTRSLTTGCMMLKTKRADLPREVVAPWW